MALGPLPDVQNMARIKMSGSYQGQPVVTLFYWHYNASSVDTNALATLASAYLQGWTQHLASAFHTSVNYNAAEAWDLASRTGAVGVSQSSNPGTRPGSPLTVNVALCSSWKVQYRWRGGHPRTYWPAGVAGDVTTGNQITQVLADNFQAGCENLLVMLRGLTINGQGGYPALVRYVHTPAPGAPPEYFNPPLDLEITDVAVHRRLDSQRRRYGRELGLSLIHI